jgi:AGZA family xanthine/uracil permease-like MFS transporter
LKKLFEKLFSLKKNGTTPKKEVLAGITTFLTMAYIIVVNPIILSAAGIPFAGVLFATIVVSAISTILMGAYANLPYALAPGMGLNAFVAYGLILGMGLAWQTALAGVFISGIIFTLISLPNINLREKIVEAIPKNIRLGVAAGIGLFLAFIGLQGGGIITASEATLVTFGGLSLNLVLFLVGLVLIIFLFNKGIKGSLVLGILTITVIGAILTLFGLDVVTFPEQIFALPSLATFLKLDILGALSLGLLAPLFTLFFTDMFDSISTFLGVATVGNMFDKSGKPKNVGKALFVDGIATTISSLFGTSPATTYIESAAGVEEGGRTGLTSIVTGLLFLPFMFLSPILGIVPSIATAPVLIFVGFLMLKNIQSLDFSKLEEIVPAFAALIFIPMTYSITMGIVFAFILHVLIKIITGKIKEIPVTLWIIFALSIVLMIIA